MTAAQCGFSYRDSVFKRNPRYVVTEVAFSLRRSRFSCPVRYEELARRLGIPLGRTAPLGETAQAVIELRRAKGMVLEADDPDSRSVGSFFTNPVLDGAAMRKLINLAPEVPRFEGGTGTKVPAAWLVERLGVRSRVPQGRGGDLEQARLGSDRARWRQRRGRRRPGQGRPGRRDATLRGPAGARTRPRRPPSVNKILPLTNDYGADRFLRV